ncbi:endodeoxyribonuclease [Oleoguttula sp. CCFEE 5521]
MFTSPYSVRCLRSKFFGYRYWTIYVEPFAMDCDDFEDLFNTSPQHDDVRRVWPVNDGSLMPSTSVEPETIDCPTNEGSAEGHKLFSYNMWSPAGSECAEVMDAETDSHEKRSEPSNDETTPIGTDRREPDVLTSIELIFENLLDVLLSERGEMNITLKHRSRRPARRQTLASHNIAESIEVERLLCFPGRSETEAWRFTLPNVTTVAVVTRILELVHEALRNETVLSKRDIYYRDPALFNKQSTVDRYVDDIAYTFGVPRSALNVTAVAKGLILGAATFIRRDGSSLCAAADAEGILVPPMCDILSVSLSNVAWILVIEKEATFRSIAASPYWQQNGGQGILVTAKGYPDLATRALLRFLTTPAPRNGFASPPVYGLVDFDPDGLAIFTNYNHGSAKLSNEHAGLKLPGMRWLGLRSSTLAYAEDTQASQYLLPLTPRDRKRARLMLDWVVLAEEAEIRQEMQKLLMLGYKAELQLLDASLDGMGNLLSSALPRPVC